MSEKGKSNSSPNKKNNQSSSKEKSVNLGYVIRKGAENTKGVKTTTRPTKKGGN